MHTTLEGLRQIQPWQVLDQRAGERHAHLPAYPLARNAH